MLINDKISKILYIVNDFFAEVYPLTKFLSDNSEKKY